MKLPKLVALLLTISLSVIPQIAVAQTYEQLIQQGKNASTAGDFVKAEAIWREALRRKPKDPNVWVFLGRSLRLQDKLDEALTAYRKAIELNPQNPYAFNGLGNTLASQENRLDEAIAAYRKAIQIDPKFGFAYTGLGNILYAQNKIPEAIAYYRKAIELDPKDPIPRNNLEELQRELALRQNPQYVTQQQGQQQTVIISTPGNYQIATGLPEKPLPLPFASVVRVVAKNPGTNYGTGWVLKRDENRVWILTNHHVLIDTNKQPYKEIAVEFYSPSRIPPRFAAKIVQPTKKNDSNDSLDIAILEVMNVPSSMNIPALQMSSIDVSSNTVPVPVRTIGHPNVTEVSDWTPDSGEINKITPQRLQLSKFTLYEGHSGSPVLDRQNHVVGIVYAISTPDVEKGKTGTGGYGFAYPIDLVKNQLRTWGYEF